MEEDLWKRLSGVALVWAIMARITGVLSDFHYLTTMAVLCVFRRIIENKKNKQNQNHLTKR